MSKSLVLVEASAAGPTASTKRLAAAFIDAWSQAFDSATITRRDVSVERIPHVGLPFIRNLVKAPTAADGKARMESFELTQTLQSELLTATHIVISTPMHIFSVPSSLKAWIDHIFHDGVVFEGDANGVRGLLSGKKVLLITSRGGDYRAASPLAEFDMLGPYFRKLFAFCGVDDFNTFDAHNALFDEQDHAQQLDVLPDEIRGFAATWA